MTRRKSTPTDDIMIKDENADPVERSSAIARLVSDGFDYFKPLIIELLAHQHFILRGEAIKVLLSAWKLPEYVDEAVRMLHNDSEYGVRNDAAFGLSWFTQYTGEQRDKIVKELLLSLIQEKNWETQDASYAELLHIFGLKEEILNRKFDRERDVDWEMLQPHLEKYGLQKPS